ncbi:MAG: hypothetical protein Q9168_003669 [Polycauliona sp. 1 TL-2023]
MTSPELGSSIPDTASNSSSEKRLEYDWDYHDINHNFPLRTFQHQSEYDDVNHSLPPAALRAGTLTAAERGRRNVNAKLANPLAGISHAMLEHMGAQYARKHQVGDQEDIRAFAKGAVLAQDPSKYHSVAGLSEGEHMVLRTEDLNRWHQPPLLYIVIIVCSTCAAVQGMGTSFVATVTDSGLTCVNQMKRSCQSPAKHFHLPMSGGADKDGRNGGQLFYTHQFGIGGDDPRSTWLTGLLNSAPYLCCAFLGCWLTVPFNSLFGRRGTIFLTCLFSALACLWQAFANTWWHMFVARLFLGLGIGPKSATVPIFAAETTPPRIRGALVMQWQVWTAFGLMLGYASDLCFYQVQDRVGGVIGLNWRLMMSSAMLPALIVVVCVFMCPESPRWYMSKGRHFKAYQSMCKLRYNKIQAARDIYYMHTLLEAENDIKQDRNKFIEIIRLPRNRRALIASELLMFMQQFCGVNIISYYSSQIFLEAGFSPISAFSASLGFGLINWIFAIPAVYTIDTFGRRNLLLTTYPFLSLFLFFTGFSFSITTESTRTACIALGIYLYGIVYSPGQGPVPFTYSAEAYPLYVRAYGMSLATATTWFFNAVLSITWPSMKGKFNPQGAFSWYAGWNMIGFFLILMIVPETKGKTLEELDQVFSVPTRVHARYGLRQLRYFVKRYLLRRDVEPERLYAHEDTREVDRGFDRDDEKGM